MHQSIPAAPEHLVPQHPPPPTPSGVALGLAKASPPGRAKLTDAPPPGWQGSNGGLNTAGIDWCINDEQNFTREWLF